MGNTDNEFNVKFGVGKLWRWKTWIIAACLAAGVISTILSMRLPDEYLSRATFVPPSIAYKGFYAADDDDIDRSIAYLKSPQVRDSLDQKFHLYEHYGVRRTKSDARKFEARYAGYFRVGFSDNSVVEINCWDEDPQFARDIVEEALRLISNFFERISMRHVGLEATIQQLKEIDAERKMINDSLASLRMKYNIYHIDDAGPAISELLAQKMRTEPKFNEYYDLARSLEVYNSTLELRYHDLRREQLARELNIKQFPTLIWVTERPIISSYKDRPTRSILVILAVMATFVFTSFLVLVLDRTKPGEA
jgi:hypothetical protein